jgi:cyclic 2,3-diphosphoglycerate synthetase
MKVIALIDGEHHPAVTRDALDGLALEHDLRGVLFVGGEEKVSETALADPVAAWGRDVTIGAAAPAQALRELATRSGPDAVVDLSGAPVLDGAARFGLASVALHMGLEYLAAGMRLTPPTREPLPFDGPVIEVIGTGKRTGKTAVCCHYASLLHDEGVEPVVVAMGRGGPAQPQLLRAEDRPDLEALRAIVRAGGHAASDYLEDAVLAGVTCVGCRRCGEGPAGETFDSNVIDGAMLALSLEPDVLLIEGSGASVPPITAHQRVCVTSAARARESAVSGQRARRRVDPRRCRIADAHRLTAGELAAVKNALGVWCESATLVGCRLDPEPSTEVPTGARVAFFSTASPEHEAELRETLGGRDIDVRVLSTNLARRAELRDDLARAEREGCDVYLTELKAAAIELVAEEAERRGVEVVMVRNRPVSIPGEPDLDAELLALLERARDLSSAEGMVEARRR